MSAKKITAILPKIRYLRTGLIAAIVLNTVCIIAVYAQTKRLNEYEKAIIAYFKLTGEDPDYATWVRSMERYQDAEKNDQQTILEQETLRLKWALGTYDAKKDFIKIKTKALYQLFPPTAKEVGYLHFDIYGHKPDQQYYFPYGYGNTWIALIIKDLGQYTRIPLDELEFQDTKKYLQTTRAKYYGDVVIEIRPISADAARPFKLDGHEHWLMMGEIANLKFEYWVASLRKTVTLWEYTAPWYLTNTEKKLLPLFREN